jgi:nucleotide-binding universal stress UspA family protein
MKERDVGVGEEARPILVAVDFSRYSEAALLWAAHAAERFHAPLVLLHVVHDPEAAPGYYVTEDREVYVGRMEKAARHMMDEFIARIRREHPELSPLSELTPILVNGLPPNRIVEVAEKTNAALIVVGSQGRTGLARLMLGSKAQRVAQLSDVPVTIVKLPPESDAS